MTYRSELELIKLYNAVHKLIDEIENTSTVSESEKFSHLQQLRRQFDSYINFFDQNIGNLRPIKQRNLVRQKSLIEIKCKRCVEYLGFDFESDFVFALELDDSESINLHSLVNNEIPIRKSQSDPDLCTQLPLKSETKRNFSEENIFDKSHSFGKLTMTESFDLKLANSLIPDFDGNPRNMEDFLDKCDFYNNQLKDNDKDKFLNFLLKVKILRDVKAQFSIEPTPNTFEEFKKNISNRFSSKITKERKMEELENLRQTSNLADFATKMENICADLIKLKMKDKQENEKTTIRNEVEENAIRIFTKGIRKTEIKQVLICKEPKSLESAVQFALEAEAKLGNMPEVTINQFNQRRFNKNNVSNRNFETRFTNMHQNRNYFNKPANYIPNKNKSIQHFNGGANNRINNPTYRYSNNSYSNISNRNHYRGNSNLCNSNPGNSNRSNSSTKFFNTKVYHQQGNSNRHNNKHQYDNSNRSKIHLFSIDSAESENESRPQHINLQQQQQ